jgi:SAM-dependent methyltransferase
LWKAEALPPRDGCADVVTAAQAFHWLDHERAVPEMRRVLRAGGRVGLFWNLRDDSVEWVGQLSDIIGSEGAMAATIGPVDEMMADIERKLRHGEAFDGIEERTFEHGQTLTEEGLVRLVRPRSYIAVLPDVEKTPILSAVRALCRQHPQLRGREILFLPYKTRTFRARVV